MSWFVVDVEADGPCPGLYSMHSFGAVRVDRVLDTSFYGRTQPLEGADFDEKALAVQGPWEEVRRYHLEFPTPGPEMHRFLTWVKEKNVGPGPFFISDNPAFDWQFINYYFWLFCGENPFGFSARRIGDLYAGFMVDVRQSSEWKKYRQTPHTHNPVDDARGNAEALIMMNDMGLVIPGVGP